MTAEILSGRPVAKALNQKASVLCASLKERGVTPVLGIIRVGEKPDDIAYENNAEKACAKVGAEVRRITLPEDISNGDYLAAVREAVQDDTVSGIILMRPLPRTLDEAAALDLIPPSKDVDGCSSRSLAGIYSDNSDVFYPCTAQAVMEILDHYQVDCRGKNAAVFGRSLLAGKPIGMLLLRKNATVTICHTSTRDTAAVAAASDILVTCTPSPRSFGADHFHEGQTVIDVGICFDPDTGSMCGNVIREEAEGIVSALSPVPGGVGTVTSSVLALHTVQAAAQSFR